MSGTAITTLNPGMGNVFVIPMTTEVTADKTTAVTATVPFKSRILAIAPTCGALSGGTNFTDVDATLKNAGTTVNTTTVHIVDGSAIKDGATYCEGPASATVAAVAAGAKLTLDIDVTGGASTPKALACGVLVFLARE